tara:strand:- start:50 stop:499 length:450 start_codon:yes stop_codon:yes gene_type:complete
MFKKNLIKFEKEIDFNSIAEILKGDDYTTQISSAWLGEHVLNAIFKIKGIQNLKSFNPLFNDLNKACNPQNYYSNLDMFFSFIAGSRSITHKDSFDVYILGVKGRTLYKIEDKEFIITPGDLLRIPKDTTHLAISLDPRIILSLGVYPK